jgi:ubiquinone/menaquinone biosynthesis C-methylase UbiE
VRARAEVEAAYDGGAAGYDDRHAADAASRRRAAIFDRIQLDAARGRRRVLELGCGTGRLLGQVDAPVRVGVDVAAAMLAGARGRGLDVARADAHALPCPDRAFDAILAGKGVFRYLDPGVAFAECARVLDAGGVLALHQYGNRTWSVRGQARPIPDLWELGSVADLLGPARRAGFVPVRVRCFRPVRIPPYLLEIPSWLDRRSPVQLWSHVVAVLNAPGGRAH